jgi:RNA polymerase sigma-70 factor (ECF subfamily)
VADDVAAETFRVAFERRHRWSRETRDALPWLLGIATNLLRRHRRTEKRRLRALARGNPDAWIVLDDAAVASRLDAVASASVLAAALAKLSPGDRDALTLVALGELTYADTAHALGISPGTVASRVNRARRRIRTDLARQKEARDG